MATAPAVQRVAVLGGGMAALTAAFELARLNQRGKPRYAITVYQQGWRLGGKGASGRSADRHQRIEEHGLHIWFGSYENAFRTMQAVYDATRSRWPHGSLSNAFEAQPGFHIVEYRRGEWSPWQFPLPTCSTQPADSTPQGDCTPRGMLPRALGAILDVYTKHAFVQLKSIEAARYPLLATDDAPPVPSPKRLEAVLRILCNGVPAEDLAFRRALADELADFRGELWGFFQQSRLEPGRMDAEGVRIVEELRRWTTIVCVGLAVVSGVLPSDAYARNDWDELNDSNLKDWLRTELGSEGSLADSALVDASYDLYFSYPRGDTRHGSIETGTMLRAALWLLLEYKGAFMWRMRSAMGDTIFAPLYHALTAMGVEFKFFHKVLKLETDGRQVTRVEIEQQAAVKCHDAYKPFVQDAQGRDCWPNRPCFDQLADGAALQADWEKHDLESDWSTWKEGTDASIELTTHFDAVVLGLPIGVLAKVGVDLTTLHPMIAAVRTVQTQAVQLWLRPPLSELERPQQHFTTPPILTTFANPIDTYADMTALADCEAWPAGSKPHHIAYFCGVHEDADATQQKEGDYPSIAKHGVEASFVSMFETRLGPSFPGAPAMASLWPAAFSSGAMDWGVLCEPGPAGHPLEHQYSRANVNASDRYVIAAKDTSRARVAAGDSEYGNLFLAGDWIRNGLHVGCIEGAVIAGKQAARALSGAPIEVVGEGNLFRDPKSCRSKPAR